MYVDLGSCIRFEQLFIPKDAENSDYRAYLAWLSEGNTPSAPPAPTHTELVERAKVEIRAQRQPIIEVLTGLQASALALSNAQRAQVIEVAKQGLLDLTDTDLQACTTYEEMRLTVKAAYYALAAALPLDVRIAFSEALK